MDQLDIVARLNDTVSNNNAIETLIDFEATLDRLNLYVYKNWQMGEIVSGPEIDKYWVTVTLLYPYSMMPDPDGAARIIAKGGRVYYAKDELITAAKLNTPDDVDPEGDERRPQQPAAKKIKRKVWLVTIELPRTFINSMSGDSLEIDNIDLDSDAIEAGYDDGLGGDNEVRD